MRCRANLVTAVVVSLVMLAGLISQNVLAVELDTTLNGISSIDTGIKDGKINPKILDRLASLENQSVLTGIPSKVNVVLYLDPNYLSGKSFSTLLSEVEHNLSVAGIEVLRADSNPILVSLDSPSQADFLTALPYVSYVDLADVPRYSPEVLSEGVDVIDAVGAWNSGYKGAGVRVGVLDLGFEGWQDLVSSGELPQNTFLYYPNGQGSDIHGSACAEIVYDVAPAVGGIYLANVGNTTRDLFNATAWFVSNGVGVISHSVAWFGWGPSYFDGDGDGVPEFWDIYRVVEYALSNGVVWVNSAGNYRESHWEGYWRDADNDGLLDFYGSGQNDTAFEFDVEGIQVVLSGGTEFVAWARWNDYNYPNSYPTNDFDMYLYCNLSSNWTLVDYSQNVQNGSFGQEPFEWVFYTPPGNYTDTYYCVLTLEKYNASNASSMFFDVWWKGALRNWSAGNPNYNPVVESGSISSPADHPGVIAVGAVPYYNPSELEYFSSIGPAFNPYIGVFNLTKPDVVAPDGVSTVSYQSYNMQFDGTSASTPHVAGAVALLLSKNSSLTPSDIMEILKNTSTDLGAAGADNYYGSGLVNVSAALQAVSTSAVPEAMLKFFRMYDAITTNDSFVSGQASISIWNGIALNNIDDGTNMDLSDFTFEASADSIQDLWWSNYAVWNSTYAKWEIPEVLPEGTSWFVGFMSGTTTGSIPISVWRSVNKTVFSSDGYQRINVTLRYDDVNFLWGALNINLWSNEYAWAEFVPGTFTTDAPVSYNESHPDYIHVEFNKSEIQPGVNYTFSVVINVHPTTSHPVEYVPQIRAEYGYNFTEIQDGFGANAEIPSSLLPPDVRFVKVSVGYNNSWTIQKGELYSAVLDRKLDLAGDVARLEYYEERIHFTDSDFFAPGYYPTELQNKFVINNYQDSNGVAINGFNLSIYTDKPIKYVWWSDQAQWGGNESYWNLSGMIVQDGNSMCCLMAAVDDGTVMVPIELSRSMNVTEVNGLTFQEVNVTFKFTNISGLWYDVYLYVWDTDKINATVLGDTLRTNIPWASTQSIQISDNSVSLWIPGNLIENRTYYLDVIIKYETSARSLVKPEVGARITFSDNLFYYGRNSTVNVSFENVSAVLMTNSDFDWDVRHVKQVTASLRGTITPLGEYASVKLRNITYFELSRGLPTGTKGYKLDVYNTPDAIQDTINFTLSFEAYNSNISRIWRSVFGSELVDFRSDGYVLDGHVGDGGFFQTTVFTDQEVNATPPCYVTRDVNGTPAFEGTYTANFTVVCDANITNFTKMVLYFSLPTGYYTNESKILSWNSSTNLIETFSRDAHIEFEVNPADFAGRVVTVNLTYYYAWDRLTYEVAPLTIPSVGLILSKDTSQIQQDSSYISWAFGGGRFDLVADRNVSWEIVGTDEIWINYDEAFLLPDDLRKPALVVANINFSGGLLNISAYIEDGYPRVVQAAVSDGTIISEFAFKFTPTNGSYWLNFTPRYYELEDSARNERVTGWLNLEAGKVIFFGYLFSSNYAGYAVLSFDLNGTLDGVYKDPKLVTRVNATDGTFYPWIVLGKSYSERGAMYGNGVDISSVHMNHKPLAGNFYVSVSAGDYTWKYNESELYTFTTFDLDGDGSVTIADVNAVAWMVIGNVQQDNSADFNGNGRVDIGDLARIVYYYLGKQ